jgi:Rrf2 family protein
MKFTRKTDYALRALQNLTRRFYEAEASGLPTKPIPVQVLAEESGLSLAFLGGIMASLSRDGVVKAVPGPKGGVTLGRLPEEITILDVVQSVEGSISLMDCLTHPENCQDSSGCTIMAVLHNAQDAMVSSLRSTNLRLMVRAKVSPFHPRPEDFQVPQFGCPVLK